MLTLTLENILRFDIPFLCSCVCLFFFIRKYKRLNKAEIFIGLIVVVQIATEIWANLLIERGTNNILLYSISEFITFQLYYLHFRISALKNWIRKSAFLFSALFFILTIINITIGQGPNTSNTLTFIPQAFIIGLFSYISIRRLIIMNSTSQHNLQLWFYVANVLYFFAAIPSIGMEPYTIILSMKLAKQLYHFTQYMAMVWTLLIIVGLIWKKPRLI